MNNYLQIAGNIHLSYFVEAADILGIKYEITVPALIAKFYTESKFWYIINTVLPISSTPGCTIAKRKSLTNLVLSKAGIPVPAQQKLTNEQDAIVFYNKYENIVIKPLQGLGGHGVSILPHSESEVKDAFYSAEEHSKAKGSVKVIGEEFITGENYRMLVLDDKVIGIVHRNPARVIGNGTSTIKELITSENEKRHGRGLKPIPIDLEIEKKIALERFTLESIPTEGLEIKLRFNANLTTGGTTEECSAKVHEYYKEIAIKAVKAIGLKYAGVDLITPDITQKATCAINEINYNPGLRPHYKPDNGEIVKVAIPIMEYIRDNYQA